MLSGNFSENIFFALNISESLKKELTEKFNCLFSDIKLKSFADGEFYAQPQLSVRGKKVFILHSCFGPVNENLMKLLVTIDACKRSSAKEINLIISYLAYARQDRKTEAGSPITSRLVADLINASGATRITTLDLHSEQIEGFFNIPIDHLYSLHLFAEYLLQKHGSEINDFVIVSPDFGATKRARALANLLSIPIVIMEKIRDREGNIQDHHVYGQVNFKKCFIFDDIIGTGTTVLKAAKILTDLGAKSVIIGATHGLFVGKAWELFKQTYEEGIISKVLVTDSVPLLHDKNFVETISTAGLWVKIMNIYSKGSGSIASIYEEWTSQLLSLRSSI